jgi:hypothetical protein
VRAGDLIAFHGPVGTSKMLAALYFAMEGDHDRTSLVVADHSFDRHVQLSASGQGNRRSVANGSLSFYPVAAGYIEPGHIIEGIQRRLAIHEHRKRPVDRIVIGNLSRWAMSMPLLAQDPNFGSTLVSLLRRYGLTAARIAPAGIAHRKDPVDGASAGDA